MIEAVDLEKKYDSVAAVQDVSFSIASGEIVGLLGPNGAGKTTFVSLVTGLLTPLSGEIEFNGAAITRLTPQQRVKAGIVRTFQINTLFRALNPLESMVLALCERDGRSGKVLTSVAREKPQIAEALAILDRFGLQDNALTTTDMLPYGQQRLLEVALALALKPQVLLLDEPAAGLSTQQGHELFSQLVDLTAGTTILFIEHDMNLVFRYAEKVSVFAAGSMVVQDTPDNVRNHPRVREVYLGV